MVQGVWERCKVHEHGVYYCTMFGPSIHYYNKALRPFAHDLRSHMTHAEVCLWKYALKARKVKGYQFRRQRPIGLYIADFICMPLKLIIEVDGSIHSMPEVKEHDTKRQAYLENLGYYVLRFTNEQVLKHMDEVIEVLWRRVEEQERVVGTSGGGGHRNVPISDLRSSPPAEKAAQGTER